jgi:hypothetical protein
MLPVSDHKQAEVFEAVFNHWDGQQTFTDREIVRKDGNSLLKHAAGTDQDGLEVGYREYDGKWKHSRTGVEGQLFPMPARRRADPGNETTPRSCLVDKVLRRVAAVRADPGRDPLAGESRERRRHSHRLECHDAFQEARQATVTRRAKESDWRHRIGLRGLLKGGAVHSLASGAPWRAAHPGGRRWPWCAAPALASGGPAGPLPLRNRRRRNRTRVCGPRSFAFRPLARDPVALGVWRDLRRASGSRTSTTGKPVRSRRRRMAEFLLSWVACHVIELPAVWCAVTRWTKQRRALSADARPPRRARTSHVAGLLEARALLVAFDREDV